MTTRMVRKQIYIQRRQADLLERLAQARGVSQAEIVRQAIESQAAGAKTQPTPGDRLAMDDFADLALGKRSQATQREPYRWNREEIYAEREDRWFRDRDAE